MITGSLTKLGAARRQLATSIDLYFDGRDPVSVYSLAANAWEIIDALCNTAGVESFSNQARQLVPAGSDLKKNYVNSPYRNFFKHADRDPEEVLPSLPVTHLEGLIFLAVEDYIRFARRSPVQFQAFQLWYMAKYPEKVSQESLEDVFDRVAIAFPGLAGMCLRDQLRSGAAAISLGMNDKTLLMDPRVELAFD